MSATAPEPQPAYASVPEIEAVKPAARRRTSGGHAIDEILEEMMSKQASDVHLTSGTSPVLRIHGEMHFLKERPTLTSDAVMQLDPVQPEPVGRRRERVRRDRLDAGPGDAAPPPGRGDAVPDLGRPVLGIVVVQAHPSGQPPARRVGHRPVRPPLEPARDAVDVVLVGAGRPPSGGSSADNP